MAKYIYQLIGVVLGLSFSLHATASELIGVYVDGRSNDAIGRSLISEVRLAIPKRPIFRLAASADDSTIIVRLSTMDSDDTSGLKLATIFSLVLNIREPVGLNHELYGLSYVGKCGAANVEGCATEAAAKIENFIRQVTAQPR